ncbi:MAG: hypothetical protein KA444_09240 [Bacteroidia bacterium]|nr:hypothetical protein [Bacteroidia bacterium]
MKHDLDGLDIFKNALKELNIDIKSLIAKTAIWVNPIVVKMLREVEGNDFGCWWVNVKRNDKSLKEERRRYLPTGDFTDDNNMPNDIIKKLTGLKVIPNTFRVCHIFDENRNTYSAKYFSSIPNLVLLPNPIFSLEEYDEIKAILKYKSFMLYQVKLSERIAKPKGYDALSWRNPMEMTEAIKKKVVNHIKISNCIKVDPKSIRK